MGFLARPRLSTVAPHCPIGFTLQLGLSKSQRDQDPTFTLSLPLSPPFPLAITQKHIHALSPFRALLFTLLWVRKADLQIQPVKREEIQAANELTPSLCLHHDDMPVHVFVCWVKLLASVHHSCQGASEHYVNVSLFPFLKEFLCYLSRGDERKEFSSYLVRKNHDGVP